MEIVTNIAPIALALIMLGLGLGLTIQDFKRVITTPKDFSIGIKHKLESIDIFNDDATLNKNGQHYNGLDRFLARKKIVAELDEKKLLLDTKKYNTVRQKKTIENRCELIGCNKKYFPVLFDLNISEFEQPHVMYVEFIYHYRQKTKIPKDTVYFLKTIKLAWRTKRGGSNHPYVYL